MQRRTFITLTASAALLAGLPRLNFAAAATDRLELNDHEWRTKLTPEQYRILRQEHTERPFTSPLTDEHRAGLFKCAGCSALVFVEGQVRQQDWLAVIQRSCPP